MNMQANSDIRQHAKARGVFWWQVAVELGVSESTVVRWIRVELQSEKKAHIMEVIDRIAERGNHR